MVGSDEFSFWEGLVSGAMLVPGSVGAVSISGVKNSRFDLCQGMIFFFGNLYGLVLGV